MKKFPAKINPTWNPLEVFCYPSKWGTFNQYFTDFDYQCASAINGFILIFYKN